MRTELLYCGMLERELRAAIANTGVSYPMRRIEEGLHNTPKKLTERIRQELDRTPGDVKRVLLGFAFCGNALAGIETGSYELIVPRADDCLTILLGSYRRRLQIQREENSYFLTEGWLGGELSLWSEYTRAVKRYGQKTADTIFADMLQHYKRLLVIDSGVSDLGEVLPQTQKIAQAFSLRHEVAPGTQELLQRLLTGPWNEEEFLIVPPHTKISAADLTLPQA